MRDGEEADEEKVSQAAGEENTAFRRRETSSAGVTEMQYAQRVKTSAGFIACPESASTCSWTRLEQEKLLSHGTKRGKTKR
jgi:hypothetical protein